MSEKYLGEEGTSRLIAKVKGYSQPRTLVSPITIGGQSQTTVETALSALNNAKCEQVSTMPTAGSSYLNKVYQFIGTTTSSFKSGCFYKCVSDGGDPATYSWELLVGDIPVDNTTIVKDGTTGELTAVQATTSTLGVVKGGDGTQISNAGGINVVNRLEETDALPTAASTNLNKCYLLKGTQSGYQTGAIYQCRLVAGSDPAEYEWVLISAANVDLSKYKKIFMGTEEDFLALPAATRKEYDELHSPDSLDASQITDSITDGDMRAVTSNAVAQVVPSNASASNKLVTASDTAKRKNISITPTASIENDIKTLLDELIVETSGSYIGSFTRTGNTSGYYSVSVLNTWNATGIVSICGAVTNAYRVAKFKSTEQGAYTYQIEKLATDSTVYECAGYLINSIAGEIEGYGRATVTLKDGVAEIKFSARIHTNTMTSTFRWGLNRDLLRTLLPNLPNITPIGNYSNLQFFAGTGAVLVDLMGYGAMASADNQFWVPARMYQIDGSTGVWGSDQFPTNSYITGTVYGIYTV